MTNDLRYNDGHLHAGMLVIGLSLKAKFLGLGILWPWLYGLGIDTSGLVNIPACIFLNTIFQKL